ncbi:CPBP family intramembrane metalloprotease [Phycicoccus sp. BSK3Z-2]|uniref:CPBP family intramembrane metalloprotease n=1 Tax=Phycicoccus avicenniae TaxID=2828860 RepID=A0A941D6U3_9MICO|nr:type II CAAX endopeptidase family protein [Phycicoccus avicenniae]MBR7741855.1 CPBP family intramembrane metalloprotease [Phycicoccus avicenniae]
MPEVAVGLLVWAAAVFGLVPQLRRLDLSPELTGLVLTALSGVFAALGFAAASSLRIRSGASFGIRRVSRRWLLVAVGLGVATLIVKSLASAAWILVSGEQSNPQAEYAQGAGGGLLYLVLATLFLGVVTPVGEELLFRGVVANALLRWGPVMAVGGSALVFALCHGVNSVLPAAFVLGLVTAELFRRTESIWPGVVVHVVVNLPAPLVSVLYGLG